MEKTAWYLVAYDISCPRRLKRLHHRLRREGVAMQKSVFLVQRSRQGIAELLDELEGLMRRSDDDLRAYPVEDPGSIWLRGKGVTDGNLLHPGRTDPGSGVARPERPNWWRRLLRR